MDQFTVKTEIFEGPLDLLLALIERRKLLINDISLATVTDDFIDFVNREVNFPITERAHFVLVASTLLLIKSKSLLPTLELTDEEEASVHDLERRLRLHKRFVELGKHITVRYGRFPMHNARWKQTQTVLFSPDVHVRKEALLNCVKLLLQTIPLATIPRTVVVKIMSLEEMIESLATRIARNLRLSFKEFAGLGKTEKTHVIVSFLAVLELVKQGVVSVTQHELFSDIHMESDTVSTPHYS
jgi:segregation and condensation protein A